MFKENESSNIGQSEMEKIVSVLDGTTNQMDWKRTLVAYSVAKINLTTGGRSTFITKKEC